jgi:hypothetical protein
MENSLLFSACQESNIAANALKNCHYMGMTGINTYKCYACKMVNFFLEKSGMDPQKRWNWMYEV